VSLETPPLGETGAEGCEKTLSIAWYALQTRSCCEAIVSDTFQSQESFYPFSQHTGYRGRIVRRPYFPGYVFCHADLDNLDARHSFIASPWVMGIVGCGAEPEAIPDMQILSVRRVAQLAVELAQKMEVIPSAAFSPSDRIVIQHGPLRGVEGYVVCAKDKLRLVVQVEMFNQAVSMDVDATWLKLAVN
jgi:transcription antitermination factor NusG